MGEITSGNGVLLGVGFGGDDLAGFVVGLLGVGGGNIIVPALVAVGFDPKKATSSTSLVVTFSSLTRSLGQRSLAGMSYPLLEWTAAAAAAGAVLGSRLIPKS